MTISTDSAGRWLKAHPRARQWAWFVILWLSGLLSALALAYPIKWLMKTL